MILPGAKANQSRFRCLRFFLLYFLIVSLRLEGHGLELAVLDLAPKADTDNYLFSLNVPQSVVSPSIEWPKECVAHVASVRTVRLRQYRIGWLDCNLHALANETIRFLDLDRQGLEVVVNFSSRNGDKTSQVVNYEFPEFAIPKTIPYGAVWSSYISLGIEHILLGLDHLLFVLGLLLIVGSFRSLLGTVTGFTLGHSITLSLAALEIVHLPGPPVEATIALSLFFLALEAIRPNRKDSWFRRQPWVIAAGFGLLHGLGFAGALKELGLPEGHILSALLAFNIGVEIGQICFVAAVLMLQWALGLVMPSSVHNRLRRTAIYFIGILSTYWTIERIVAFL